MVKSATESVTVTKIATTLSITVTPGSGPPISQSVTGYLKDVNGYPLNGKTIELWKGVGGAEPVYYGSATTFSDGSYGFYGVTVKEGSYLFEVFFDGDLTYSSSVKSKTCTFAKVQAAITIAVSPTSGLPPLEVVVSGKLTRADTKVGLGAKTIKANRTDPGGSTKYLGYTTTSIDPATLGNYAFSDTIPSDGTWKYQTEFEGDDWFKGCGEAAAPCPGCGQSLEFSEEDSELNCGNCGAVLEIMCVG